jgi:hypothetical protein
VLSAVGCAAGPDSGPVAHPGPAPDQPKKTEIVTVVGVTAAGDPAPGYVVEQNASPVSDCSASPAGGVGVVWCSPSAADADVCWVGRDRLTLYCGLSPWERRLSTARADQPVGRVQPVRDPQPWGLILADGAHCTMRNGGAWGGRSDGLTGAYSCDRPSEYVLVGTDQHDTAVDKHGVRWTVRVGDLGAGDDTKLPPPTVVPVQTAYLAGP